MKFFVNEGTVEKQVTAGALKAVHEICKWLYDPPTLKSLEPTYRYAQSIITRSEAEVFGLSSPRFAVRMRLANGSFFNLRRLSLLASRASLEYAEHASRLISHINRRRSAKVMTRALIDPCTAIADSILQVPTQRFDGSYEILTADIGGYYGETDCKPGVPYLQHIELGGGLCAQAVSFMVMLHYHKRVNGIGGIPEITHTARNIGSGTAAAELHMSGLSDQQVSAFFRLSAVGLRCHREMYEQDVQTNWDFEKRAIQSYLRSNVPIILPLSLKKMWLGGNDRSSGILLANRVFQRISKYPMSPVLDDRENHFVLLGGVNKRGTTYILHDPATVPFLQCTFDDLLKSRRDCKTHPGVLDRFRIFPVVPCEVRSSLLDTSRDESDDEVGRAPINPGLMRTVRRLQTRGEIVVDGVRFHPYRNDVYSPGDFLLIKRTDNDAHARLCRFLDDERLVHLVEEAITAENLCDHWVWLQRIDSPSFDPTPEPRLWLWDAEVALSQFGQISDYLVAIINVASGTTQRLHRARPAGIAPPLRRQSVLHFTPQNDVSQLKPALMSSYAVSAFNSDEEEIRPADAAEMFREIWDAAQGCDFSHRARCELYVMMEPEIRYWQRIWRNAAKKDGVQIDRRVLSADCAIDFLAAINAAHCVEIAKEIAGCFAAKDIDIVAIATYLPEIARRYDSPSAEKFVRAMKSIGRIARALQGANHPIRAIELVGGSRVAGPCVKPTWVSLPTQYSVRIEAADDCIDNLIRNLAKLVCDEDWPCEKLPLCFELEPGEFFVLNSLKRVQQLVRLLQDNTSLSQLVGFNVDVSHWRLSGVDLSDGSPPEPVQSDLCSRVFNSHLSGHHPCAHIADIEPLRCAKVEDYAIWSRFLRSCTGLSQRRGNADGSVSLELEAVDRTETVEEALRQLFRILA